MNYKYSMEHEWTIPQNYSFSSYEGPSFIKSYFESREDALNQLNANHSKSHITTSVKNQLEQTEIFLREFLDISNLNSNSLEQLSFFIHKFEVSKLLYSDYSNLESKSSYFNLSNYILLSKCCLKAYQFNSILKYLNVSLKLNDLSIARLTEINKVSDIVLLEEVINDEIFVLKRLIKDI